MVLLQQTYDGNVHCSFSTIFERRIIVRLLRIKHPDYWAIKSRMSKDKEWDGIFKFFNSEENTFPFGFLNMVQEELRSHKVDYKFTPIKSDLINVKIQTNKLRPYQVEAVKAFLKYKHGILKVPTRGGKTFIASEILRIVHIEYENPCSVFFVDTDDLFFQAIEDVSSFLEIPKEDIGYVKEGKIVLQEITICSVQSVIAILDANVRFKKSERYKKMDILKRKELVKSNNDRKKILLEFLKNITFYVIDECHVWSGKTRLELIKYTLNRKAIKLFISASPFKSESVMDNYNLMSVSGNVVYEIHEKDLKEQGYLAKDKIMLIMMNHEENRNIDVTDDNKYDDFHKQVITHNKHRNSILIFLAEICRKLGLKTLVLFSIKKHGNYIKSIMGDPFVNGDTMSKDRQFLKNEFLNKDGGVLLASDIFNKGITLPQVQVLINGSGGLEGSVVTQKKGRILGTTDSKKKALTIDFVDIYPYFSEHSLSRIKIYEESVEKDDVIILDSSDDDFFDDFRREVSDWFDLKKD